MSTRANPRRVTTRGLNRALLERQWLLARVKRPAADVIEHLVGLQAQATNPPYVALWARVQDFRVAELSALLTSRRAVRLAFLRSTIHLVTARDCLALRPAVASASRSRCARRRQNWLPARPRSSAGCSTGRSARQSRAVTR